MIVIYKLLSDLQHLDFKTQKGYQDHCLVPEPEEASYADNKHTICREIVSKERKRNTMVQTVGS